MRKYRQWYSVEDAAEYLTEKINEKIQPLDIFSLALDGYLKLSLNIQTDVLTRKVRIVRRNRKLLSYLYQTFIQDNRNLYFHADSFPFTHIDYAKPFNKTLNPIQGIHDLSLLGEDRHLVETEYCRLADTVPPNRRANQAHGIILDMGEQGLHQIQMRMNVKAEVASMWQMAKHYKVPDNLASHIISRFSCLSSIQHSDPEVWRRYIPAYVLPSDAFFVVRTAELDSFIAKEAVDILPASAKAKSSSRTDNIFIDVSYALIAKYIGEEAANNPRKLFDAPDGKIRIMMELRDLHCPSGQTVERHFRKRFKDH